MCMYLCIFQLRIDIVRFVIGFFSFYNLDLGCFSFYNLDLGCNSRVNKAIRNVATNTLGPA